MMNARDLSWLVGNKEFQSLAKEGDIQRVQLEVEVCMECGKPHTTHKTCLYKRERANEYERWRAHAELRNEYDMQILEHILAINGYKNLTHMIRDFCDTFAKDSAASGRFITFTK